MSEERCDADFETARLIDGSAIIVIKVGSALLIDPQSKDEIPVRRDWLAALARDIAWLGQMNKRVIVTTSGAIAIGRSRLGLNAGPLRLDESQAASAAGQAALIDAWGHAFAPHGLVAAQILLTLDDTENRRRYLNARQTITTLMDLGAVPVINENDTVATSEIRYGDNDRLAAHAAQLVGADCLIILSDIDGLYTADPSTDPGAQHIPVVDEITPEIEAMAGKPRAGSPGSGGMATKLAAARIAAAQGCASIIAHGRANEPISALMAGARATIFRTAISPASARKAWIANRLKPAGEVHIDAGALDALHTGASLLPAGVTRCVGDFRRGDAVLLIDPAGRVVAQGLVGYDADELAVVAGKRLSEIDLSDRRGQKRQGAPQDSREPAAHDGHPPGVRRPLVIDRNNLVMRDVPAPRKPVNRSTKR